MKLTIAALALIVIASGGAGIAAAILLLRTRLNAMRETNQGLNSTLQQVQVEKAQHAEQASKSDQLNEELESERQKVGDLRSNLAETKARYEAQSEAREKELNSLKEVKSNIEKDLKLLTGEVLKKSQSSFLELAKSVFEGHSKAANEDLEKHQMNMAAQLAPIKEVLEKYQESLSEVEKSRIKAYGQMHSELKSVSEAQLLVRDEASKLVNALRAAPKTRGRWGEETLRNVMELSGMSEYCDFDTEVHLETDTDRIRPDVIIRMPGERYVIVDAKTSTAAYMDAIEAEDDTEKEKHLATHARQIRDHMRLLSGKKYQDGLPHSPDFVAMFIPGENFYAAAIERDPELFEDAITRGVLIVTPTTLIALAKAIAFGWRQEKVAENARHVAELGKVLYQRLVTLSGHLDGVGKGLDRAVKNYNGFVGSLEGSVLPQARKFSELEVEGTSKPLPEITHVEAETREPRKHEFAESESVDKENDTHPGS